MSICIDCNLEMTTADGCTLAELIIDGAPFDRQRCSRQRCGDCGAKPRNLHHLGCDLERCPRCGRQLISCGCWSDGPGDGLDDEQDEDVLAQRRD
jgi:hypothetical protein